MSGYDDIFPGVTQSKGSGYEDIFAPAPAKPKMVSPQETYDPTSGMSGMDKFLAGAGKTFVDTGRGIGQIGANIADFVSPRPKNLKSLITGEDNSRSAESLKDIMLAKARDRALMGTGAGVAGNIAGGVTLAAPTALIPGANTYTGAALTGAVMNALQPVGDGESRTANTVLGAAGGALGQGAANVAGKIIAPVKNMLTPETQRLAQIAAQNGIPLNAADLTGSKALGMTNSVLSNLPFTGATEAARDAAKKTAFNKAVMSTAGEAADNAAPETLKRLMDVRGKAIGDIAKRSTVNFDDQLLNDLGRVETQYNKVLDPNQAAIIKRNIDALLGEGKTIPGETYQATRQTMGALQRNLDPNVKQAAGGIKAALDSAMERSLPAADVEAWQTARQQYGNLKTISKAMESSAGNTGDIPASQLRTAVKQANPYTFPRGDGQLNDIARVGEAFVRDKNPNSGTAQRMWIQSLLSGGAAGAAYGSGGDPGTVAAAAAAGLLGPKAFQKLLNTPGFQAYLTSGPGREAFSAGLQRLGAPLGAGAGLLAYSGQQ